MWTYYFFVVVVLVAWLTLAQAQLDHPSQHSTRSRRNTEVIEVNPGEPVYLNCGPANQSNCIWESGSGNIIEVRDVYNGDVYSDYSKPDNATTQNHQCDIVLDKVEKSHNQVWDCMEGRTVKASVRVVVRKEPTSPVLDIDNSEELDVTAGQEGSVVCSVAVARPAVDLQWYLGTTQISNEAGAESEGKLVETVHTGDLDKGFKTVSTLKRKFLPEDNGKNLTCTITHKTLTEPDSTSVILNVTFKPIGKEDNTLFAQPGTDYEIIFNYSANPEPMKKKWKSGPNPSSLEEISSLGEAGRYSQEYEKLDNDKFTAKLLIKNFTEDANKIYTLEMDNSIGQTTFVFRFSQDDPSKDGLSGGIIALIVISVLGGLAAIGGLLVYAQRNDKFPFGGKSSGSYMAART